MPVNSPQVADPITQLIRTTSRNFILPLFDGRVDPETVYKESSETKGKTPVTLADVGEQIVTAREIAKLYPTDSFFGEEFVPLFTEPERQIVNEFELDKPLSLDRPDHRAYVDLLRHIITSGEKWSAETIGGYCPTQGRSWLQDSVDGTIFFKDKDPRFSNQLSFINNGRIEAAWIYRPVTDELFRRIGNRPSEYVTFDKETGRETVRFLPLPPEKPLSEMTVVYPKAHPNVTLDAVTAPLYEKPDGTRYTPEELAAQRQNEFHKILPTDGYSFYHGELFLRRVDAVSVPGTHPWDHFAQAFISQGMGLAARFYNGEPYLGPHGEIPLIKTPTGEAVKSQGGVLYTHPNLWQAVNHALNLRHHPHPQTILSATPTLHRTAPML